MTAVVYSRLFYLGFHQFNVDFTLPSESRHLLRLWIFRTITPVAVHNLDVLLTLSLCWSRSPCAFALLSPWASSPSLHSPCCCPRPSRLVPTSLCQTPATSDEDASLSGPSGLKTSPQDQTSEWTSRKSANRSLTTFLFVLANRLRNALVVFLLRPAE